MSEIAYDGKPLNAGDTVYEVHPLSMTVAEILPKDEACFGLFTVKVEDSDNEYKPSALTHEPFYRFPPVILPIDWTANDQIMKIRSEMIEAKREEINKRCEGGEHRMFYGMELIDIIHAAETALRMEFTPKEAVKLWKAVEKKNRDRGYYGGNNGEATA